MSVTEKNKAEKIWENIQLLVLGLTIVGQMTVGIIFLLGQGLWLVSNTIALIRDFALHRPPADKIKNAVLTSITFGIILSTLLL